MAFNFGGTGGQQPATGTAGYSLGGGSTAQTGFNFGGAPRPAGQQATTTGGFAGFGATTSAATAAPTSGAGFNFGMAGANTKAPSLGGFSFGQTTATSGGGLTLGQTATTSATTPGFSLSGQPASSGFSLSGQTAANTAQQPAAATTGFSLTSTQPATSAPGFSLTSQPAGTTGFSLSGQPAASTGGFSLTGQPAASTAATSTAPAPTAGFGVTASSAAASGTGGLSSLLSSTTPATTASTAATSGFSFGASAASTSSSVSQAGTPASLSFGTSSTSTFSLTPASSTAAATTTAPSSLSAPTGTAPQKAMTFRQLEETINKWSTELEEQEKYFLDQATQVNAWDRIVMDNGDKIIQLNQSVEKVKLDQQKLDHELDFVHSQQRELEELLGPLEKPLDNMPPISYQQHADLEREHTYMLAESLDAQLKRMGQDLKEIIERLNANNATKPEQDDPVQQITKILNAHVVSLMWVDRNTANLQKRIEDISRQMDIEKREQERNFRLAYS